MKITALVPESLIEEVKKYSGGKNVTESLIIALTDYTNRQKLRKAIQKLKKTHLSLLMILMQKKSARLTVIYDYC